MGERKTGQHGRLGSWDDEYKTTPPWDIGRPQPAFVSLVRSGELRPGSVLDVGCGTGENVLFLAQNGFSATGVDLARLAIEEARRKSQERGVRAVFKLGNALTLDFADDSFDDVIDSGLFHTLSDPDLPVYAAGIARVLKSGGKYFMLCFSDKEPIGSVSHHRSVSRDEIQHTFQKLFRINYVKDVPVASRFHEGKAYLTSATKPA